MSGSADEPRAGVVGAGTMGAGIAHALLLADHEVTLVDRDPEARRAARGSVRRMLAKTAAKGLLSDVDAAEARLRVSGRIEDVAGSGLAIEAVFEYAALKATVLASLDRLLDADALLASNTSGISIGELAASLERPERFLGLHFFNPVPASSLVEIVVTGHSSEPTIAAARRRVTELGKESITVRDSPGFAGSRLGVALGLEAIRMLEESVASAADIDRAMALGYRHPIGPLRLTDLVGLDVRLAIAEYLHEKLGERFRPPDLLREKVRAGELGRKSGAGFFSYE